MMSELQVQTFKTRFTLMERRRVLAVRIATLAVVLALAAVGIALLVPEAGEAAIGVAFALGIGVAAFAPSTRPACARSQAPPNQRRNEMSRSGPEVKVVRVSPKLAAELSEKWSPPVQIRLEPTDEDDAELLMIFRRFDPAPSK